jgi:hypothetical protein
MKKLSVEEEVKRGLITAKYQYPAYCTTYDKEGNVTSERVVTHNERATKDLKQIYPEFKQLLDNLTEVRIKPRRVSKTTSKTFPDESVWRMWFRLGKNKMVTVPRPPKTLKPVEQKKTLDDMDEEFLNDVE